MSIVKLIAAGSVAILMTAGTAAAAEECTDEMLEERQEAFGAYLEAHPDKAETVGDAVAIVEKKYGGEPPRDKQCEAMDQLLEEIKKP